MDRIPSRGTLTAQEHLALLAFYILHSAGAFELLKTTERSFGTCLTQAVMPEADASILTLLSTGYRVSWAPYLLFSHPDAPAYEFSLRVQSTKMWNIRIGFLC